MTVKEYLQLTDVNKVWFNTGVNQFEKFQSYTDRRVAYFNKGIEKWLDKEVTKAYVMSNGVVRIFTKQEV